MSDEICIFSADTFSLRPALSHSYHPNVRRIIVINMALARTCAWAKCFKWIELSNELKMMQNQRS